MNSHLHNYGTVQTWLENERKNTNLDNNEKMSKYVGADCSKLVAALLRNT